MQTDIATLIDAAAAFIKQRNPGLAARWMRDPFSRVDMARAFAAGFKLDQYGDAPKVAWFVIRVALADQAERAALASS